MYSTCLFCKTNLGANEAIEQFPVGRRLAFDSAKGRLWVVCRTCERWNLTPIEERWEAIEQCESAYRGTKLRASTEHIGLARVREGTELVRIGSPLRPEFAAWRYGDQFGKRRKRQIVVYGTVAAVAGIVPIFGALAGASLGTGAYAAFEAARFVRTFIFRNRVVTRLTSPEGRPLIVRRRHAEEANLLAGGRDHPWRLRLEHSVGRSQAKSWWEYDSQTRTTVVQGEEALRVVAQILPALNPWGASNSQLKEAITLVEQHRDTDAFFRAAAKTADRPSWIHPAGTRGTLQQLPFEILLALEMISHEESERRAIEGDLRILEEAWKEAEEIAAISDNLFLPAEISTRLTELKRTIK
jgi:hypothetical protein